MPNPSFYSFFGTVQEADFFTDTLIETGEAGELEHTIEATLEEVPELFIKDAELLSEQEQDEIEMALFYEDLFVVTIYNHTDEECVMVFEGTLDECKEEVYAYQETAYGKRFDARFFETTVEGWNNERVYAYAEVHFYPKGSNDYTTMTWVRNGSTL